jgi:hypothetical protein
MLSDTRETNSKISLDVTLQTNDLISTNKCGGKGKREDELRD